MLIKKQHNKNINFSKKLNKDSAGQVINGQNCGNFTVTSQTKKLSITLRSYGICQVKDNTSSIRAIEKLINYLNYVCAKQLHTNFELGRLTKGPILRTTRSLKVLGFFTPSHTQFLSNHTRLLSKYSSQQSLFKKNKGINCTSSTNSLNKVSPTQSADNFKHIFSEKHPSQLKTCLLVEQGRCFFKLSKKFSSLKAINKKLVQRKNSKKLFTLIRAPFVFKKTREQFNLQKFSSHIVITFANSAQKDFIIQNLRLLKLPTELKLVSYT